MSFASSVLLLVSVCLILTMPYALGHALAAHNNTAIVIGLVAGAVGLVLFYVQKRMK
jgi:hypothetical protein